MIWLAWVLIVLFAADAVRAVVMIGRPRQRISLFDAAAVVAISAGFIAWIAVVML